MSGGDGGTWPVVSLTPGIRPRDHAAVQGGGVGGTGLVSRG